MKKDLKAIADLIVGNNHFLITSHINPDGDSIASQLALRLLFLSLGKSCTVVNLHPVPRIYRFLPGAGHGFPQTNILAYNNDQPREVVRMRAFLAALGF